MRKYKRRIKQLEMELSMKNEAYEALRHSIILNGEQAEKLRFQLDEKEEKYTKLLEKYTALLEKYRAVLEKLVKGGKE